MNRILMALLATLFIPFGDVLARQMTPAEEAAIQARLEGWAKKYYPEVVASKKVNDGTFIAVVVDSKDKVLDHAKGTQLATYPAPTPLLDELTRLLPRWKDAKFIGHGGTCFGSPKEGKKYCVIFGVLAAS